MEKVVDRFLQYEGTTRIQYVDGLQEKVNFSELPKNLQAEIFSTLLNFKPKEPTNDISYVFLRNGWEVGSRVLSVIINSNSPIIMDRYAQSSWRSKGCVKFTKLPKKVREIVLKNILATNSEHKSVRFCYSEYMSPKELASALPGSKSRSR